MYGFQKRSDRPQPQKLADGGEVTRLGFKSKAQQEREQATQAGSGPVRGPGTGTSDAIKATVPPGTYIMPADSTRAMGVESLSGLGFHPKARAMAPQGEGPKLGFKPGGKVPVNLSNGEFQLSPEQVHAIGAQVLDQMKDATHKQVEQDDEQMATDALYFANGGMVEDPKKGSLATSPTSTYPGNQAEAAGNIYAKSNADMASAAKGFVANNFPASSAYISDREKEMKRQIDSGNYAGAAGTAIRTGVQGAGIYGAEAVDRAVSPWLNAGARLAGGVFGAGDAQASPVSAPAKPTPAAPATPGTPAAATASNPIDKPGTAAPAVASPTASAATAAQTTAAPSNNVTREGNSFSGQNIGAGFTINGQQPRTGGYVTPAEYGAAPASSGLGFQPASLRGGGSSPDVMGILQRESQIRQSMAGLQDQVAFSEGTGGSFRKTTNEEIVRDMLVNGNSRDRASALGFMAGNRDAAQRGTQTEQELALRQQDLQGRQGIANEDLGLRREAQGFQTAAQRQVQALQQQYIAETDPTKRNELARQLTVMQGKAPPKPDNELAKARVNLIAELGKQYGASTPYGKDNKPIPFETWAEPMLRAAGMVPTDPRQREGVMLRGKDGKMYRVQNGEPVLVDALSGGAA